MKFTIPLTKQLLYRMMKNQWKVARKRRVLQTSALKVLKDNNLEVVDANEFVSARVKIPFDFSSIVGLAPRQIAKDENHPLYNEQPCYVYRDSSVLLEGLHQALALTNTVQLQADALPKQIEELIDTVKLPNQDQVVQRSIKTSCLYDTEQKKLPIKKDPQRPAWVFPRDYGITESRKNRMLCSRLVQLCWMANPALSSHRALLHDVPLAAALHWQDDLVLLQLKADDVILSDRPLHPLVDPSVAEAVPLPELSISHPLISLHEENFYEFKDIFSVKGDARLSHVHTLVVHYNPSEVRNIFETPVEDTQLLGRSLVKAYTAAVTQARYNYGHEVEDLPEPVVVQCVQTDGHRFHFSVLQLNTASVTSERHNVFWSLPLMHLYDNCSYVQAVPSLQGYNPSVFQHLLAFYINGS